MGLELLPPALARAWGILTTSMRQRSWGGPVSLVRKLSAGCGVLGGWPAWPGSLAWHCFAKSSAWRCWVGVGTPPVSHFEPRPLHAHMGGLAALGKRSGLSVSMVRWCCMVRPGRSTPLCLSLPWRSEASVAWAAPPTSDRLSQSRQAFGATSCPSHALFPRLSLATPPFQRGALPSILSGSAFHCCSRRPLSLHFVAVRLHDRAMALADLGCVRISTQLGNRSGDRWTFRHIRSTRPQALCRPLHCRRLLIFARTWRTMR